MRFAKYQALGNDYLVIEAAEIAGRLTPAFVRQICDRHFGVGADGVLIRQPLDDDGAHPVRILNPDGSEAEKSGNGLRIFARYLWDAGAVSETPFRVRTAGGIVQCHVLDQGRAVAVDMGRVSFHSADIPVAGPPRQVLQETLIVNGQPLVFSAATIGNPHCVILRDEVAESEARRLGPLIETHPLFPNHSNVQFMQVVDRQHIRLEIWERGAGYTLASGSSSCAAAAVALRLGLCDANITVAMPGGELAVEIDDEYRARLTGPVAPVFVGELAD